MKHEWLKYKNWAVVGASTDPDRYGYKIFKRLKDAGYHVYPVTPNHESIDGIKTYPNVSDIPDKIDVVDFVVRPDIGVDVVKDCAKKGIDKIILQPGTVSEELLNTAKSYEIEALEACVLVLMSYAGL